MWIAGESICKPPVLLLTSEWRNLMLSIPRQERPTLSGTLARTLTWIWIIAARQQQK